MSFKTKNPDATPWWAKRRVLGSALAITALVASGAAAQASSNGDGFLTNRSGTNTLSSSGTSTFSSTSGYGSSWTWSGSSYTWNGNVWGWNGTGINRFGFRVITSPQSRNFTQALGINDRNVIVGVFGSGTTKRNPNRAFAITTMGGSSYGSFGSSYGSSGSSSRGFGASSGSSGSLFGMASSMYMYGTSSAFHRIVIKHAVQVQAVGVNNRNDVAGFFVDAKGNNHGFVLWHNRIRVVDFPHTSSRPAVNQLLGINNFGVAAGFFNDKHGNSHGYLFNAKTGKFILLKLPVHTASFIATGVNDRGQVTGFFKNAKRGVSGFIWSPHQFVILNLGTHRNTMALGINNAGTVVGSFIDAKGRTHGFLRVNQKLIRTIDVPGAANTVVNGLNNRGLIVGFFTDHLHRTLGFVAHR